MGQTGYKLAKAGIQKIKFQSPYGVRGRSDMHPYQLHMSMTSRFQSPYGVRGRSDNI